MGKLTARTEVVIDAPAGKVWEALTRPELISRYLFGTKTETTWQVGSPLRFRGEWEGKTYEDKGTILANEPNKRLKYDYWSSMSGMEDKPENYMTVEFILSPASEERTRLELVQGNIKDEQSRDHSMDNWKHVLAELKNVAEEISRLKAF